MCQQLAHDGVRVHASVWHRHGEQIDFTELARQIIDLKRSFQAEAAPERLPIKSVAAEAPVTIRIRQRETVTKREYHHPAPAV